MQGNDVFQTLLLWRDHYFVEEDAAAMHIKLSAEELKDWKLQVILMHSGVDDEDLWALYAHSMV